MFGDRKKHGVENWGIPYIIEWFETYLISYNISLFVVAVLPSKKKTTYLSSLIFQATFIFQSVLIFSFVSLRWPTYIYKACYHSFADVNRKRNRDIQKERKRDREKELRYTRWLRKKGGLLKTAIYIKRNREIEWLWKREREREIKNKREIGRYRKRERSKK